MTDQTPTPRGVRPLSTVIKTLALLDVLAQARGALRLADVVRLAGGERATVYQRLITLKEAGFVEQLADGSFRLSLHTAWIAHAALEQANLGTRTIPIMQKLVYAVHETASLAVLEGDEARIVQRVESEGVLRADMKVGASLSLDNSATGRIFAAFAPPEKLSHWRSRGVPLPDTAMLDKVRRENYAEKGDRMEGIGAIAAGVFDRGQRCIAALSLVGPDKRFDAEACRAPLLKAAAEITAMISGPAN